MNVSFLDLSYRNIKIKFIFIGILTFGLLSIFCYSSDVLYIDISAEESVFQIPLETACKFYGLDIEHLVLPVTQDAKNDVILANVLNQNKFRAIVISAWSLKLLDKKKFYSILKNQHNKGIPLLILGIVPDIEPSILTVWSNGGIKKCKNFTDTEVIEFYQIFDNADIARQLTGLNVPFVCKTLNYFLCDKEQIVKPIIQVNTKKKSFFPIFVYSMENGQEIFFLMQNQLLKTSLAGRDYYGKSKLYEGTIESSSNDVLQLLPIMMFLRYCCGQNCWHSPGFYANLTIDDPWLKEPYGHLSYKKLVEQMKKYNFHTTIAFIPWNYDRSEEEIVNLFHNHSDELSICVHGNDHDHYEFYKYEIDTGDPWPAKSLKVQEANIKQAIARMEKFRRITGLSYDRVMIFPHGISPLETLKLLKKYNFLATLNANNVPLGSEQPKDKLFYLRPFTLDFGNFASIKRYEVRQKSFVDFAIDLFLGNPILIYEHHQFFSKGIDVFNEVADAINRIEPAIEWQSLGYIARHLYLQRLRNDGNYDIRAFCKSIELENLNNRDVTYFIQKEETFSPQIKKVINNGEPYLPRGVEGSFNIAITIPAGESRIIDIEYENDFDLNLIDITKNDSRVNRLRRLSDFRDIKLSKNFLGRTIIFFYYETGIYKLGLKKLAVICLLLAVLISLGIWCLVKYIRIIRLRKQEILNRIQEI